MRFKLVRWLLAAAAVSALTAPVALAGAARNARYSGATAHGKRPLTLQVAGDRRRVTMNLPFPPLFCQGGGALERQISSAAAIT